MTTAPNPCPLDGTPLPTDRNVCRTCTATFRSLLTDLPDLMADLDIALSKTARFQPRVGSRSTTASLPFGYAAAEATYVLRQTVLIWVDWVTAVRAHRVPETWDEVGDYLRRAAEWIARHPDGPQIIEEITACVRNARRTIDRPADRRYVGTCKALIEIEITAINGPIADRVPVDCPQELYASADRPTVECPRCGTVWDVRARQDRMLEQLRDHTLTATDMARAVDGLGVEVTPDRIRQWKKRHQLAPVVDGDGNPRADVKGRPLYRVGDVLDLVSGRGAEVAGTA